MFPRGAAGTNPDCEFGGLEDNRAARTSHLEARIMPTLTADGFTLAYDDVGPRDARQTVVMLHGFATNRSENWRRLGWLGAMERKRVRAVALDFRGHGESSKPHDPAAYADGALTRDVCRVMDACEIPSAVMMGFSMGAAQALDLAHRHPERAEALILGGVGGRFLEPPADGEMMAEAMEAEDPASIAEPLLRSFRQFADEQGEDRLALAACSRALNRRPDAAALMAIRVTTLIVAGVRDDVAGDPDVLAAAIPGARAVHLPGCDHFSAIAHALHKAAVFDFLEEL